MRIIIFLLILLKVKISQQNLNASSTIITRKLMHKNGLKEFTVQKNIKGNECACACYCSLPNSQDAMAQMRLTSPNVDLAKFTSPNSTRRFEIEKIISGNQCKCSCVCAEPENTIYDENDSQIESKKNLKEEIGIMKNDNKNDVNLVKEKKSNLEEFVETSTSNSISSTKEIEPNLSTNSFEKISSTLAVENNKKWTMNKMEEDSSNSMMENKQNPTTFTTENDLTISSHAIEQNPTTNSIDTISSSSTKENEPISTVTDSTNIVSPIMSSTQFIKSENSLTSSAAESEEIFSSTVKYGTSPNSVDLLDKPTLASIQFGRSPSSPTPENLHNNNSGWHKIDSNKSDGEKRDETGIRDSTENVGATKMREEAKGRGSDNDAFAKVENSEQFERTFTTPFLTTTPSSSSPEIVQIVPDGLKTTKNMPEQGKTLEKGKDHFESSSEILTTPIGWISSSNSFYVPTTLSLQNQNSIEKKIITSKENANEQLGKLNGIKDEKMTIKEERKKEENIGTTTESFLNSTVKYINPTTPLEDEADEEKSTFDPQFKAKVAQLLNKLKVKLFRLREMEQEKNISRNGTENAKEKNAEKNEKKENGEERQIFFQIDQKVEEKNWKNLTESEKNGTYSKNEVIGPTELPENKNTGQNEKNVSLDVPEGRTSQINNGLLLTTLAPQFSAFVTSDGTEDLEEEENELKTTSISKGINEMTNLLNGTKNISNEINGINEESNSTSSIKDATNSINTIFTSSTPTSSQYPAPTPPSPHQLEEETTLNPVFKARVANLLNRLKEQLYRLRAAQQQNSTLNGTNSEGKHSIEANPLANLLNASSSNPVSSKNGNMLSKSEQMLEGLQRKLELLKLGEKQVEKVENSTNDGMANFVGNYKTSGTKKMEDFSLNEGTTISSRNENMANLKTTNSSRSATEESINVEMTISGSSAIETSTNILHKMNGNNLTESTFNQIDANANESLLNSNHSSEIIKAKNSTVAIQIQSKTSTTAAIKIVKNVTTNNSNNLQVKTENLPLNPRDTISVTTPANSISPSITNSRAKEVNPSKITGKLNENTTLPISNDSILTSPIPNQNDTTKTLLEPIIGQSKNLAESSTSNVTTENSIENEEEEGNFAFVTEEPEMPKMTAPSSNGGNSSEFDEERPIIFVLNETAAINNGRGGNDTKNVAIGFNNLSKIKEPKNESNNEGHLFPFTNDFLIDLPPKMEKGKQQEMDKGDKKWEDENIEEESKQTRVILLPASPRGRIHNKTKSRAAIENASKPDEIQQMNENSSPVTVEQNWPSLITIKEKEDKNVGKTATNGKSMNKMIEGREMDKNDTKIPNKVESSDEDNRVNNLPKNSPKLLLKLPKLTTITTTTIMTSETMTNSEDKNNLDEEDTKNWSEQQNLTTTQKTTKKPRRKFVAPQAQNLIERLEQARKLREEQVKLEMMEAIRQEQIGSTEPDPQLAERRREIEQRLLQLAQAERLHREMLEEKTAEAQKRQNVGGNGEKGEMENIDGHSTIQPQSNTPLLDCSPIRRFLQLFHISNPHEWIEQNCKFARRHFPNASCPQIGALLNQCFQESQQKEEGEEE